MHQVGHEVETRDKHEREDANLRRDLRRMSRDRGHLERSGNEQRIGKFNKDYVGKIARLSLLCQKHNVGGGGSREEIKSMMKTWKGKLGF